MLGRIDPRSILLLCLIAAFAGVAVCGDAAPAPAAPDFTDAFDFSAAVKPRPGDWLEYLVAFPADPLERELGAGPDDRPGAAAVVERDTSAPAGSIDFDALVRLQPVFEPPKGWTAVPVRLSIREVGDDGCNAEITFAGDTRAVRLPADGGGARAEFQYDSGAEAERTLRVGGREYVVRELRRGGPGYGFVRWFSAEIPFGTVRFATELVDMQLVGFGRGTPPDFPVRPEEEIAPPPGALY